MALKATIYKAKVQLSDLDQNVDCDHSVTIARHLSETDERLLVRLLAFALNAPRTCGSLMIPACGRRPRPAGLPIGSKLGNRTRNGCFGLPPPSNA